MTFAFWCKNEEELKECSSVVCKEVENHGITSQVEIPYDKIPYTCNYILVLKVSAVDFFNDLEKAKTKLYEMIKNKEPAYMTDLISDIQEYLSFVPTIKCMG